MIYPYPDCEGFDRCADGENIQHISADEQKDTMNRRIYEIVTAHEDVRYFVLCFYNVSYLVQLA